MRGKEVGAGVQNGREIIIANKPASYFLVTFTVDELGN